MLEAEALTLGQRVHGRIEIDDPDNPATTRQAVRTYATGGQKSVHEIYLTAAEKIELLRRIAEILDPRAKCQTLGLGTPPSDTTVFYVG